MVGQLNSSHKSQAMGSQQMLASAAKIESSASAQQQSLRHLLAALERLKRVTLP